jgi:hypothetical protein
MRRKKSHQMKAFVAFAIFILHASLGAVVELFVAPAPLGSDSNPGTRAKQQAEVQQVNHSLKPGDTLTILSGTYTQPFSFAKSGTAEARDDRSDADQACVRFDPSFLTTCQATYWLN